ncbi:AAA family ATPase, partial [Bergeyella sp. RCAD1439]|uniref:AAA family ATPase n=1 Tax=Bergeyella anatis TaxID=3113737 RepID=UPI002E189FE0|nr:AAA family ATPase [Bergeyella sp. RCAD1439]
NTDYTLKKKSSSKFIDKYCIDKLKETNKYDYAIVGRATETQQIVEILSRFSKPNILLIGDSGVGKTAVIKSFIDRVRAKEVPDWLVDLSIYELDMSALIAGASYKGEIEDRLKNIAQELRVIPKSVLIIEELHTLLSSHSDSGVANLLKGELAKGLRV